MEILIRSSFLIVVVAQCCDVPIAKAQGVPEAPSTTVAPASQQTVQEVWPRIVYLMDEEGNPTIPWVDFPWERYALAEGITEPREIPQHLFTELRLEVSAEGTKAIIEVTLRVHSLANGTRLVPIEMGGCHFTKQPTSKGAEILARFNEQIGEYELLLSGEENQDIDVQFTLIAPIQQTGDTKKLRLALPRVPVSSMTITVPEANLIGELEDRMSLSVEEADGTTRFNVNGLLPNFEFAWRSKRNLIAEDRVALEVEGDIRVQVDGRGMVTSDVRLAINSLNLPIARIRVRLPANTRLADPEYFDVADYSVIPQGKSADGRHELEVVFAQSSHKPPVLRLQVQGDQPADADESSYELAGFEVVDAASQYGEVIVYSEGDRRLGWLIGDYAQRINSREGAKAAFAYYQPNQLRLTISRQPREVLAEPLYFLHVAEDRATLNAIYRCNTGGANLSNLTIDLGPWTFDGLGKDPQNLIGDEFELRSTDRKIELPLNAVPDSFEIAIIATLVFDDAMDVLSQEDTIEVAKHVIDFQFPYPEGIDRFLPSTVAISSESDVVLAQSEASKYTAISLPQRVAEEIEADANPLCLRFPGGVPSVLSLAAARLERSIAVICDTDILEIAAASLRVRQRMRWEVDEVQLPSALLTMPKKVYESGNPQITINGKSTVFSRAPTFGEPFSDRLNVRVPLEPMIGAFEMTITYDWSYWEPTGMEAIDLGLVDPIFLDLVLPKKDSSSVVEKMRYINRLRKRRVAGYQILLSTNGNATMDFDWITASEVALPEPDVEAFTEELLPKVPLTLTQVEASVDTAQFEELVDRAWYQTWYTDSDRTDRAVFRVQGGDATLRIDLPSDTDFRKVHAWVDGRKSEFSREGTTQIELNVDPLAPVHVVELRYAKDTREPPGLLTTRVPVIEGADILGQWYWHVVMPRNECLVSWPRNLTRAHRWDWSYIIPRTRPQLVQAELENWSGAMRVEANVLLGSTEYLFGAMGEPERLSVRTAPLPIYVLVIAGLMLVFGLLLMHARPAYRVALVCAAGSLIAGLIFVQPSYGAIGGQAAVLGAVLVAIAGVLTWLFQRAGRRSLLRINSLSADLVTARTKATGGSSATGPQRTLSSLDPLQSFDSD